MSGVNHAPATTARLDDAWHRAPAHFRPVIAAVRDHGVGMLLVSQGKQAFRLPRGEARPAVMMILDDFDTSHGPGGFHLPSIRRLIRNCSSFVLVAGEATERVYATAASAAASGARIMLVETRPEHEIPWAELIQKFAPGRPVLWSTVKGGRA